MHDYYSTLGANVLRVESSRHRWICCSPDDTSRVAKNCYVVIVYLKPEQEIIESYLSGWTEPIRERLKIYVSTSSSRYLYRVPPTKGCGHLTATPTQEFEISRAANTAIFE